MNNYSVLITHILHNKISLSQTKTNHNKVDDIQKRFKKQICSVVHTSGDILNQHKRHCGATIWPAYTFPCRSYVAPRTIFKPFNEALARFYNQFKLFPFYIARSILDGTFNTTPKCMVKVLSFQPPHSR